MQQTATSIELASPRIVDGEDLLVTLSEHHALDWVHLYHFSHRTTFTEAVRLSKEAGIRPVSVEHLEALGQQHSAHLVRRYAVVNILTEVKCGESPCLAYLVGARSDRVHYMGRDASAEATRGVKPSNDFSPTTWFIGYRPPRN